MRLTAHCLLAALIAVGVGLSATPATAQSGACAIKRTKIVGGSKAAIDAWPGQAALRLHADGPQVSHYFCGGTAINDRWVLTAAHCLHDFLKGQTSRFRHDGASVEGRLEVVLEVEDLRRVPSERVFGVERVVIGDAYARAIQQGLPPSSIAERIGGDIGLVRLARPWTGRTADLSLASGTDPARRSGVQVRTSGFGLTDENKATGELGRFLRSDGLGTLYAGSPILLETAVETVAAATCKSRYGHAAIGAGQVCAGHEQKMRDSCSGDSGGPLIVTDAGGCPRQIGIVSWGQGCADRGQDGRLYYGVYTRVSAHADWIARHAGPLNAPASADAAAGGNRLTAAQLAEALAQLGDILGPARGRVSVGLHGGNRVRLGSRVVIEAASSVAGRLILLDVNADRDVLLLYPNMYVTQGEVGRIGAGARVTVPGTEYPGFTSFQAVEPIGSGRLLAIVAPLDFDIERFVADRATLSKGLVPRSDSPSFLMRLIRQIETAIAARTNAGAAPADALGQWGYALADYEITR